MVIHGVLRGICIHPLATALGVIGEDILLIMHWASKDELHLGRYTQSITGEGGRSNSPTGLTPMMKYTMKDSLLDTGYEDRYGDMRDGN
jgi:hypothetical protein